MARSISSESSRTRRCANKSRGRKSPPRSLSGSYSRASRSASYGSSDYSRARSYSRSRSDTRSPRESPYSSGDSYPRRHRRGSYGRSPGRYRSTRPEINKRIVIVGITKNVNMDHLREIFGHYGSVIEVFIPTSKLGFNLDGYACNRSIAYVEYKTRMSAKDAIGAMNRGVIDGMEVRVEFATDPRTPPEKYIQDAPRRVDKGRFDDGRIKSRNTGMRFDRNYRYNGKFDPQRKGVAPRDRSLVRKFDRYRR